ncbi:MAG: RrF2 family transcriptional regulator [Acidobacteriota bacterium]
MKLSKRGEYGIKALIDLASGDSEHNVIQIRQIAEREKIPVKFLEQILLTLKNAGLLHSRLGANGGYYLARHADEITLGQIVRTLDGTLAPIRCVSKIAYERCVCPDEETCGLRLAMLDVRNAIADILDHTTLADVAHRSQARRRQRLASTTRPPRTRHLLNKT